MTIEKIRPACIRCRFCAKYAPLRPNEKSTLRCVRYAPHAKLSNTDTAEAYDNFFPNFPVVADQMFCGEFEAKL